MSIRTALVSAIVLAVACGAAVSEPPKLPIVRPSAGQNIPPVSPPIPTPPLGPTAPAPREKSVDDLLAELEDLQAQKARLEKQEAELKAAIRKKLDAQNERLKKLGFAPKEAKEPDRVGRIIIEGNTKTPDSKILDKLNLRPGTVLQYPALEEARTKLEKAGFGVVEVEAIANELDATFKDIRVKVEEPKPKPVPKPAPTGRS